MGFSCSNAAAEVVDGWATRCRAQTRQSNVFEVDRSRYFLEESREEQADFGVTGEVYIVLSGDRCRKVGDYRLDGEGRLVEAPQALRAWLGARS